MLDTDIRSPTSMRIDSLVQVTQGAIRSIALRVIQHHIHTMCSTHTLCTCVPTDLLLQVTQGAIRSIALRVIQHHIHTMCSTHTLCTCMPTDLLSQVTQGAIRSIALGVIQHHIHTSAAMLSESCSTIYTPKKKDFSIHTHYVLACLLICSRRSPREPSAAFPSE